MHTTTKKRPSRDSLTVSQLNRQAKRLLEGSFPSVWVEGEISNLAQPSSGHWYFSLKDSNAQIRCAMFHNSNARLRFQPEAGQLLLARAKLSLYEARGDYQLIVEHLEPAGIGALSRAFEELKNKLQQQGLFNPDSKQALPPSPRHIAVVTSPTGAAIHDILTVLARRFPAMLVTVFPTSVQGQHAAAEIAAAIKHANQLATAGSFDFDLIITGRGGGSIEDLWAFNEEVVAQAIYQSRLPIVSAVGHEVDFTIADFVADVRAPTPSAAAELISPDCNEMVETFNGFEQLLNRQMRSLIETRKQRLGWLQSQLRHPGSRLQEYSQRLDELEIRLLNSWRNKLAQQQSGIKLLASRLQQQTPIHRLKQLKVASDNLYRRLQQLIQQQLQNKQQRLRNSMQLLDTVSPLATLDRGYSIVSDTDGKIIRNTNKLKVGQQIVSRLAKGHVRSCITDIEAS
jgi:exodeoxyribonuclease VII large subunit